MFPSQRPNQENNKNRLGQEPIPPFTHDSFQRRDVDPGVESDDPIPESSAQLQSNNIRRFKMERGQQNAYMEVRSKSNSVKIAVNPN